MPPILAPAGDFAWTWAKDFNGSNQYLETGTGLGLEPNEAKTFGVIARVDSFAAQRVLMSIGINGAGTSRLFLSTAITTGNPTCTTTDAGVGSSSAVGTGVAAGVYALFYGIAYEGNTGREVGCNRNARGVETTTRATTMPPNTVKIGVTPSNTAHLDGAVVAAWVVRGVLEKWQTDLLADFRHITSVAGRATLAHWMPNRLGMVPDGLRRATMMPVGTSALVPGVKIQQAPRLVRVYVGRVGAGAQNATSSPAIATWTAPAATAAPGTVTATSTPATATWTAPAATAAPGSVTATSTAAAASWVAPAATATAGAVTATADTAVASWSVPAATAAPGTATVTATAASASWVAPAADATTAGQVLSTPAVTTWVAPAATAQAGVVTVDASPAIATWATPTATATGGNTVTATASSLSWVAPAASATSSATVAALPAIASWVAPDATATPGAMSAVSVAAVATWVAPAAAAFDGSIPTYTVLRIGAARAGRNGITARAGRSSLTARTHLSE